MEEIRNKFWAIGGGKGGVGKSVVTLMLGASLAKLGKRVILVDADLGGGNLHTLMGIRYPKYTIADFLKKTVHSMNEVVMKTPIEGLMLVCGADDILGIANPKHVQKLKIFRHFDKLNADVILIDLGAGSSFTALDFFLYAPNKIVIVTPQITSVQNAYGFIKASLYRQLNKTFSKEPEALELISRASFSVQGEKIDSVAKLYEAVTPIDTKYKDLFLSCLRNMNVKLVLNMMRDQNERRVSEIVKSVAKNYLSLNMEKFGAIRYDKELGVSINNLAAFLSNRKDSVSHYNVYNIACKIINPIYN